MARYINEIATPMDARILEGPIADYLTKEGFSYVNYKGVGVWKKGIGFAAGPQFILVSYGPNVIHLEAFIRFAILPGVYVGEMGIDGVVGTLPKSLLKTRVNSIEQYIYSLWRQPAAAPGY